ncbi:MAG: glycosyl transferase [Thermomicrobiales bacterium]|nr:MAG: glycosyl transferase [Thermomicrobiales bacterium]
MKVAHVITSLTIGGAEMMLLRLLSALQSREHQAHVICLRHGGAIADRIEALGVPVERLNARPGLPNPALMVRLAHHLRRIRPDVVQTWMYHADLFGGLAAQAAGGPPVAWGLHHSTLSPAYNKRSTLLTARACAHLSRRLPAAIVCCAESTRRLHAALGYDEQRMVVIPNGFDLDEFRPDPAARIAVREELGLSPQTRLVGLIARFHPQKDHRTFIEAAGRLCAWRDDVHVLLAGGRLDWDNTELVRWIDEAGIRNRCHLLGRRTDISRIQASLDVACLSSQGGEALPLTVGEAMASGVPCVVTDVGDAALLVGDTGRVAPVRDPEALAQACLSLLELPLPEWTALGAAARRRIAEHYALPDIAQRYAGLWDQLAERGLRWAAEM